MASSKNGHCGTSLLERSLEIKHLRNLVIAFAHHIFNACKCFRCKVRVGQVCRLGNESAKV